MLQPQLLVIVIFTISFSQQCSHQTFQNALVQVNINDNVRNQRITKCIKPPTVKQYQRKKLREIKITGQNIPDINTGAIQNFPDDFKIIFERNNITTVHRAAFRNLPKLNRIDLNNNNIERVSTAAFLNLPSLVQINLAHNQLKLYGHNIFKNLPQLTQMFLNDNLLEFFEQEWFKNMPKLELLDLSSNRIQSIPKASFTSLSNLEWLSLTDNRIDQIHKNAFDGLGKLWYLGLGENRIKAIDWNLSATPDDIPSSNLHFTIHSNPLQCACYDKIVQWAYDNNVNMSGGWVCNTNNPICVNSPSNPTACLDGDQNVLYNLYYASFNYTCG